MKLNWNFLGWGVGGGCKTKNLQSFLELHNAMWPKLVCKHLLLRFITFCTLQALSFPTLGLEIGFERITGLREALYIMVF